MSQNYTFDSFKTILQNAGGYGVVIIALAVVTIFIMLLIECCRVPVDDPTTHLELTMIHEVMILDNSGVDLGLITWGAAIKMFLFEALIAALIIPSSLGGWESLIAFLVVNFALKLFLTAEKLLSCQLPSYRQSDIKSSYLPHKQSHSNKKWHQQIKIHHNRT